MSDLITTLRKSVVSIYVRKLRAMAKQGVSEDEAREFLAKRIHGSEPEIIDEIIKKAGY